MKKALLIVNPSSGGEKAKEYEEMAENKLRTIFDEVKSCTLKKWRCDEFCS